MFERTVSLWRRLIGSRPRLVSPDNPDDRRVWVRFPADLETTCRPAGADDPSCFSAVVRDISGGGLSLSTDRAFAPGDLLTVELPGPDTQAAYAVLACVVHVNHQGDGQWVLGCTFSRELSDDDLAPFGARRSKPQPSDQRTWDRYTVEVHAGYQLALDGGSEEHPARVLNISPTGVGLLVEAPVAAGTVLSLRLRSPSGSTDKTMLSCVVHVNRQAEGEWALGCNFISELSESELLALL
jgi:hypothetical protein